MWLVWPDQIPGTPCSPWVSAGIIHLFQDHWAPRDFSSLFHSAWAMFILYLLIKKQLVFNVD